MEQDILTFVRRGLKHRRNAPGWLTIAAQTDVNYSTIWRIAHSQSDSAKISTLTRLAEWLRKDEKKRVRA